MKIIEISPAAEKSFWDRVAIGKRDECWPWLGYMNNTGYGMFYPTRRAHHSAHRVAWFLHNRRQPAGFVCHECDNPPCCNPHHLWLGDAASNAADKVRKGRSPRTLKSRCKNGHDFTPANTYVTPQGWKQCRACNLAAAAAYKRRQAHHP